MAESGEVIPAGPIFSRLTERGQQAEFCRKLHISQQTLINWRKRGVPLRMLKSVCTALGISPDAYRVEAGLPPETRPEGPQAIDAATLMPLLRQIRQALVALERTVQPGLPVISVPGYRGPDRRSRPE